MQKQIAWNSGNGNITLTYQGEGDGAIAVSSDENNLGIARSQTITVQTTNGAVSKNVTIRQAACPFPSGNVANFGYTGMVQEITLPKGRYKIQCWGAQGGSNAAYSSYGITAQAGGKGGYSEGVLTLTQKTTLYVFVGGQGGSSGNGGWNGGGGGSGTCTYNSSGTLGYTKVGGGGGATDIALVTSGMAYSSYRTNRSSASLLSRIIVAGGGSGGSMGYKAVTTTTTTETVIRTPYTKPNTAIEGSMGQVSGKDWYYLQRITFNKSNPFTQGNYLKGIGATLSSDIMSETATICVVFRDSSNKQQVVTVGNDNIAVPNYPMLEYIDVRFFNNPSSRNPNTYAATLANVTLQEVKVDSKSTTTTSNVSQAGYAGGGAFGLGYSSSYYGKQNSAGSNGAFGLGATQRSTSNRYHGGLGGGGWYGGGTGTSDSSDTYVKYSGGGSGFVNTAANASYRPSGYTGLQLDSGTTTAGTSSFESTSGGRETGHSGNGYARITRLE